jgi:hypothetical protein
MSHLQAEPLSVSQAFEKPTVVTGARSMDSWDDIELALLEARGRVLSALDRELDAVRTLKARRTRVSSSRHEVFRESQLPSNVLPMEQKESPAREEAPPEATLDPALERATIEELNAALAAAFNQMSSK